jgi:hypothetical protein
MSRRGLVAVALCTLAAGPALAAEPPPPVAPARDRLTLGLELDALPFVLSAVAGQPGGAGNLWIGLDRLRLRAVGAHVAFPSGLTPTGFQDRELTVAAGIVDCFFRPGFDGPWVGAGFEYWWNTIGSPSGPSTASWNSWVATLGGGFVWKFWGEFYLNPWAAAHLLLSTPSVTLYGETWKPAAVTGEVSVKLGWSFTP